ncbi:MULTISPECIES: D-amino acid dehydrogenase [unclassified Ectothiorhodospira]|uniref:D-amino acid dehydrogenase n=1 Tax=unclassified Ectothiorhodospira TaxID=2684909 RepID=UPI001EE90B24|nr:MULTISPECIES: D-amino acid dehydrogenase [unclassified Ectothiorhodospira]MCG5515369.1 D-amino acid dehydrogenase [Ectothiorhodospira sp. 9100]MCG5519247.1 D-amino acid dehydrogenase [Ectothiorhodospira sp. 9905]
MKILVLGSGVIGVTSAWYLARAGHEVTVVDQLEAPAMETSHANAGMLSFDHSTPWAAPGVPFKAVQWLMQDLAPLYISPKALDIRALRFLLKMLGQCSASAFEVNKERMLRVARYSAECFKQLREDLTLDYDGRQKGTLELFRTEKDLAAAASNVAILERHHIPHALLDVDACIRQEPALAHVREKIAGGVLLPGDETGDCHKFTCALAKACETRGVTFLMNTRVEAIDTGNGKITGIRTSAGTLSADRYVLAMGCESPRVLGRIGIHVPVYPLKGYSLTMPILDEVRAPQSTVMDQKYKVAVTRFDQRIRVGGVAEIAGDNKDLPPQRRAAIEYVVRDLFPGGGAIETAEFWAGLRPMTPDSVPILGSTNYDNLFLNIGHGTLGWTMSLGSSRFVADLVGGHSTDIDPDGLGLDRYA